MKDDLKAIRKKYLRSRPIHYRILVALKVCSIWFKAGRRQGSYIRYQRANIWHPINWIFLIAVLPYIIVTETISTYSRILEEFKTSSYQ